MENICAILDAQGFIVEGKFFPREMALAHDGLILNFDVDPKLDFDLMVQKDKRTNYYIMKNITGLTLRPKESNDNLSIGKLGITIAQLYHKFKTEKANVFGIKNPQLSQILIDLNIPFKELDIPSVPQLMDYYKHYKICERHTENENGVCAVLKVELMAKWIEDNKHCYNFIKDKFICID